MSKKLIIIGASGHGKVAADIALKMNVWEEIVFLDDINSSGTVLGFHIIGNTSEAPGYLDKADFFIAIGNNTTRELFQTKLEFEGANFVKLVHPESVVGTDVEIGEGSVVMAGVVINSSTKIGKGCILNTSCSLDHDNQIEDFVHISPGAHLAGNVKVCEGTWIGIGSAVSNNVAICSGCIIGAGSVVIRDISEPGIYVGSPARRIDR